MGEGVACTAAICLGACCKMDQTCVDTSPQDCAAQGGEFTSLSSECAYTQCPGPGWCCLPTGCAEMMGGLCRQQGGIAGDPGTTCADVTCAPNDACVNAIEVAVPSTTGGSTVYATNDPGAPACSGTSDPAPGVWYKVVGTGNTITAQTCNTDPSWDMQMGVYCTDCGNMVCVGGGDDTCGQGGGPSLVSWCSRTGVTYLIRCYGWGGATGDFRLDVTDDGVSCASTDPCSVAPPTGACCVHSSCTPDKTQAECVALGGTFQGGGSACAPTNPCPACPGDANCDGLVNFDDINPFVSALAGGPSGWASYYASQHGGNPAPCPFLNNDANGNGLVNFDDINPFVSLLVSAPHCP
jgi:hypothetical protein